MYKRVVKILAAVAFVLLLGAVALAQPAQPPVHGPFPLERPLESSLEIAWDGWNPVTTQVIPEGCLGNGFATYLTLYNSGDESAMVSLVISGVGSYCTTAPFEVKPHQRQTWDVERVFDLPGKQMYTDVAFQIISDTPGVYAQVTMIRGQMGYTSEGFFK